MDGTRFVDAPACELAVIVPLFRQPALFSEAMASVLDQVSPPVFRVVIVLDGCIYRQSLDAATTWARAHPGRVVILPQANRGVAAARNAGMRFALDAWPDCRALFFLDADNRVGPHMLRRAFDALADAPPGIGWVYPDFDLFGIAGAWSTAGPHHLLQHLSENVCDAAVLVRREVADAGVAFDASLKAGFEDWDFFLRAADAGFRGAHLPKAGFLYRRRPESMLRDARRAGTALFAGLQARHPALYAPRRILELEAAEAPRFAVFMAQGARACLDPVAPGVPGPAALLAGRLAAARQAPGRVHAPAVCVFAEAAALDALRDAGLLRATLAHAERLLDAAPLCLVTLYPSVDGRIGLEPEVGPEIDAAQMIVARSGALPASGTPDALAGMAMRGLSASIPAVVPPPGGALAIARAGVAAFGEALAAQPRARVWRPDGRVARDQAARRVARSALRAWPLLPMAPDPARRDIAFVTPVFDLGGVERVLACLATELRARGWRTHLVVTGAERIASPPPGAFDGVVLLPAFDSERHGGGRNAYAGAATSLLAEDADEADALLGLLAPMQAVVTTHAFAGHALAGRLRRMGVRTACALHLAERGRFGEPIGNPHSALAYEHAYDLFIAHSRRLVTWCAAAGVPGEKIVALENAPGYPGDAERIAAARAARQARAGRRLRALVLGRLDRQKGPDRLPALMAATQHAVEWRVVGRAVLDEAPVLPVRVEAPVAAPAALDALYTWADVLVMPSRFEGVPLTILEAQRMGCIPVATDVGGVAEAVTDGVDGVLVADGADSVVVEGMTRALLALAQDAVLRESVAERAMERGAARRWGREAERVAASLAFADEQARAPQGMAVSLPS